jgi:hypothetical protein
MVLKYMRIKRDAIVYFGDNGRDFEKCNETCDRCADSLQTARVEDSTFQTISNL